jgi:uncharacterized protein (TIGR02996 family)
MARDRKPRDTIVTTFEHPVDELDEDPTNPGEFRRHWGQQWLGTFNPPAPPRPMPQPPPPVHHPVLSDDKVEHELLAALRERPDDETTRGVYADWLEQHGHLMRARFVRDDALDPKRLVKESTAAWRAITSRATVIMCWSETCPRRWHLLRPTPDENVRSCGECKKVVRFLPRGKDDDDSTLECYWRGEEWVLDVDWHE